MSGPDEIKSRIDIVSYIHQYVPLKKAGRYYKACCPFHSEKTPSFVVNQDNQSWRCFGACAEGGDLFSFAMKYHGWDFREALETLAAQAGIELQKQSPLEREKTEHHDRLRGLLQIASDIYHEHLLSDKSDDVRATLRYVIEKRGLSVETIKSFGIGYAPPGWRNMLEELQRLGYEEDLVIEAGIAVKNDQGRVYDRFRNRLMVPIRDDRGRVIGFGARILDPNDNPKYLNSPQTPVFDKSRVLFGLDAAKSAIRESETAVIVEGYMDAIQAHQAGFTNVVAQMGTALTETQLQALVPRYANKIVMALDSDEAGQSATRRSLETARQALVADYAGRLSVDIRILQIPGAKDPDDLIREAPDQWQALVAQARPVADYVIDMETVDLPVNATVQEREIVARRLLPMLVASEKGLYRQANIQKLALRLRIGEAELLRWAEEEKARNSALEQSRKQSASSQRPGDNSSRGMDSGSGAYASEPPPFPDLEMLEPPPYDYDDGLPDIVPQGAPALPARAASDNALEAYCLRMLILHPETYFQVNRKFRELAGENGLLREGPLHDLGAADFTMLNYRLIMQSFIVAVSQDDMDILDYLKAKLDESLAQVLEILLEEEHAGIQKRLASRFGGDLAELMKHHDHRIKPSINLVSEILKKSLGLRQARLNRELQELGFMQGDLSSMAEDESHGISQQVIIRKLARDLLDAELQRQLSYFT